MINLLQQIQARVSARYAWPALILGTAGLTLSGCPGGAALENAEEHLEAGEACNALPIFESKCGGGICHGTNANGNPPSGGVNLTEPGVAARLLDVPASYPPPASGCPDTPEFLVNSANVEASLMWTKLNNIQACGEGMPSPYDFNKLNQTDLDCVYSWLQSIVSGGGNPGAGGTTGTGGDAGSTGGDTGAGGTTGTGGDAAGTGGGGGDTSPIRVQAECALGMGDCTGVTASFTGEPMLEAGNMQVGYITTGVTLTYGGFDTAGHDSMTLQYAKASEGGSLEIRLESSTGTLIGTATPAGTGAWDAYMPMTVSLSQPLTGTQTIVFVALGSDAGVLNLDWFELTAGSAQ